MEQIQELRSGDRQRQLGLVSAAALVVANMIGTGVFTTSGFLLADLKSPWVVLAAWGVGGVQAALGALCYGALGRRIPESGGEYVFLSRALHPAAGYLAGWVSLLVGFSAPLAVAALAFGEYVRPWLPGIPPPFSGTLLLLGFSALHASQVRRGVYAQNWVVLMKVTLILAFVVYAGMHLKTGAPHAAGTLLSTAFPVSLVWISFSYSGWNAAVYIAGEIRDPERNLPRALLLGTATVTLLYLGLNAVFVFSAPVDQLSGKADVGRIAAAALGGPRLAQAISALVALALVSSVSSMMVAGPRVYAQMARDGYLPRWMAAASGPPRASIAFQLLVALVFLWSATLSSLLTCVGFTLSLSTAATVLGLIILRVREGPSLRVPGWPLVPGLFLLVTAAMTVFTAARKPRESLIGLACLALGWLAWQLTDRSKRKAARLNYALEDP
jgi:APA family basic amino acid/polyamine antiporter